MIRSIGAIEFKSIAKGIEVSNEMVKKHIVEVLYLKSICPGKFLVIVSGDVADVNNCIDCGMSLSEGFVVDSFVINSVHNQIIDGLKHRYESHTNIKSVLLVETNRVCAGIKMLDKTLKSANVNLAMLQLSFTIAGKLVYMVSGDIGSLESAIEQSEIIVDEKNIVYHCIIPSIDEEIIKNLVKK